MIRGVGCVVHNACVCVCVFMTHYQVGNSLKFLIQVALYVRTYVYVHVVRVNSLEYTQSKLSQSVKYP